MRKKFMLIITLLLFIFIFTFTFITANTSLAQADSEALATCTNGKFQGIISGDILIWKGIPYAKQPVDSLRWKAPEAPDKSSEVYNAFNFASTPLQIFTYSSPHGEDCLALNIWNNKATDSLKPVMVWVHGGEFAYGGTAAPEYDGLKFIQAHDDVILVTIGYRLGIMGFIDFANSELEGCEDFPDSANLGLLDVLQAVKWLHENIQAFGGDPDNITLFGESAGGALISLLMSMPESQGLFKRAITESGSLSMTFTTDHAKELTQYLIQLTGAKSMSDLMNLASQDLQILTQTLYGATNYPERDGKYIALNPYEAFARNSSTFDFLTGTNADEINNMYAQGEERGNAIIQNIFNNTVNAIAQVNSDDSEIAQEFIDDYIANHEGSTQTQARDSFVTNYEFRGPMLLGAEFHRGNTYVYNFEYPVAGDKGAPHMSEIAYVFNDNRNATYNQDLADKIQSMWINFAKTGDPSLDNIIWPKYDTGTQTVMRLKANPEVSVNFLTHEYEIIRAILSYGFSGRDIIEGLNLRSNNVNNSSGGCNGFIFPLAIVIVIAFMKRKI